MKLNHTGKRLTAGLLSCAMALSLCAPALAEGTDVISTLSAGETYAAYAAEGYSISFEDGNGYAINLDTGERVTHAVELSRIRIHFVSPTGEAPQEVIFWIDLVGSPITSQLVPCTDEKDCWSYDFVMPANNVRFEADWGETGLVGINSVNFPDDAFRRTYVESHDTDKNGSLSQAERNSVTAISIDKSLDATDIKSLKGIEFFPNLTGLYCSDNALTSLDVSKNTKLTALVCSKNQLTRLDVRENTKLRALDCSKNLLTSLDLGQNTDLTRLICSKNQLTSLDLSKNTDLSKLDCSDNKFQITVSGTGQFDLSTLPGFDASKAKWPADTAVWENILTVPYGTTELSYEYDLGNGETGTFTLTFGEIEEPDPVTPEDPEHPMDPDFGQDAEGSSAGGAIAAAALGGAAVWGGYEITTRIILHDLLPEGADIPASRSQLALLIWTEKGKPEPAAQPAFADVTDPETAKAAQWCVEQGLLTAKKDGSFGWTPKYRVIQVWNQAFPKQ